MFFCFKSSEATEKVEGKFPSKQASQNGVLGFVYTNPLLAYQNHEVDFGGLWHKPVACLPNVLIFLHERSEFLILQRKISHK